MKWSHYILLILFASCGGQTLDELRDTTPVLTATLRATEAASGIRVFTLTDEISSVTATPGAMLEITPDNGDTYPLEYVNGQYESGELIIEAGKNYTIRGKSGDTEFNACCTIPPQIAPTGIVNDTITVDLNLPGTAFFMTWTPLDDERYSYVLDLELLEDMPVEIPFITGGSGNFDVQFSGPQENAGVLLFDTDFKYYGWHRLTVYAIDRDFEEVYFYGAADLRGLLRNGPDNVNGGKGFVTGVSSFQVELFLQ